MFKWLKRVFKKVRPFGSKKPDGFKSQQVAISYSLSPFIFLALQSLLAGLASTEFIFPNLPTPITFQSGRAMHLNLSILWPLLGMIGAVYYFLIQEAQSELYRPSWAKLLFWWFLLVISADLVVLALGFTEGREYLEALWFFDLALIIGTILYTYNLLRTALKNKSSFRRPTVLSMLVGSFSLVIFFAPNIIPNANLVIDETMRFWVVHLWEELSFELTGTAIIAALLLSLSDQGRRKIEQIVFLELAFVVLSGFLATAHHYYWIGLPRYWLWIGGIFSTLQVLPILLLAYTAYQETFKLKSLGGLRKQDLVALGLIFSSIFYHLIGAGALGFFMAIPRVNLYVHGTLLTSSHSHLALFGVHGFLVLGAAYYILTRSLELPMKEVKNGLLAVALLNIGLLIMGGSLFMAGVAEAYLWRVTGLDFVRVQSIIRPYYITRAAGGAIFAIGAFWLAWHVLAIIRNKKYRSKKNP